MSFIDCVRLKSETDLFKPWIVLGVWQVFVLLIGWGLRGVGWTRRFTTLPMKSAAIMRRIRGLVPGFFLFEWLAVYWWKRAEVPDATVLSAFP